MKDRERKLRCSARHRAYIGSNVVITSGTAVSRRNGT